MKLSPLHNLSSFILCIARTFLAIPQCFPYKDHCFDPKCFEFSFTSSPSHFILPFSILSLLSAIWVIQQCAKVLHLSDMFAVEREPARKYDYRIKVWTVLFTTMGILISTLGVREPVGLHHRPTLSVLSTAYDWFRLQIFYFQSMLCHHRWRHLPSWVLLLVVFYKFKLKNVKTAKYLLEENPVLVKELNGHLPLHQIHPFLQS